MVFELISLIDLKFESFRILLRVNISGAIKVKIVKNKVAKLNWFKHLLYENIECKFVIMKLLCDFKCVILNEVVHVVLVCVPQT